MSIIKFLKIGLPITTATSATIFTTLLVSEKKNQIIKQENFDNPLNDFELPDEKFEDEHKFYTKNKEDEKPKEVNKETREKINQLLDNLGKANSPEDFSKKMKKIEQDIEELINTKPQTSLEEKGNTQSLSNSLEQKPVSPFNKGDVSAGDKESSPEGITKGEFGDALKSIIEGDSSSIEQLESALEVSETDTEQKSSQDNEINEAASLVSDSVIKEQVAEVESGAETTSVTEPENSVTKEIIEEPAKNEKQASSEHSEDSGTFSSSSELSAPSPKGDNENSSEGKKELTEEEIRKWEELGSELNSVSESLKYLFNW